MRKNLKKDTGVTLIALVVTVVVLLILAAVNLAFLTGDNGVISKAKEAAKATNLANTAERIAIDLTLESTINKDGTVDTEKLNAIINSHGGELQDDGDTIKTDDGDLSLKEIMGGDITVDNKDEKIKELERLIEELEKRIQELENENKAKDDLIAELERQLAEKEAELEDLRRQLEEANAEIERLNERIAELEAEIAELQKTIDDLRAQLDAANATIEALQKTIEELRAQIADLQTQLNNANATIAELQKKQATGNATVSQVLAGKTFSNSTSVGLTGTMTNNGAVTKTLNAGGSYTIPAGYHNGSGKVTVNSLASQTSATATAAQILTGKTAWVNGSKITGTMPSRASSSNVKSDKAWLYNNRVYFGIDYGFYPSATFGGMTEVSEKYISYSSLASTIGLTADKIVKGNTILGIAGNTTYEYGMVKGTITGTQLGWVYQHGPNITAKLDATYSIPSGTNVKLVCFTSGGFVGIWTSDEPTVIRTGCQNHTMQFHGSYAVDGNFKVTNTQATFPVVSWDNNSANWSGDQGTFYVFYSK